MLASAAPAPGLVEAQAPLAWVDSAAVVLGEDAAWDGFGASLARLETHLTAARNKKPRAVFTFVNGSSALERTGMFLARSDAQHWLRVGSVGMRRGGVGALDLSGEHLWSFDGGLRRGAHRYHARFTQRGMGAGLAYPLRESGRGMSGDAGYDYTLGAWRTSLALERGFDIRTLSDASVGSLFAEDRRDAQQSRVLASVTRTRGERVEAVRVWAREGQVVRQFSTGSRTAWKERAIWAASRVERPWQWGTLELQLGGGWSDAAARSAERAQLAPGLAWRYRDQGVRLKLFAERMVDPIWSDLDPSVRAFVQDTWTGGLQVAAGEESRRWVEGALLLGQTGNKATLGPYPLREVQLRAGYLPEARRKEFTLAMLGTGWRTSAAQLEASGFALVRDRDGQRWIDPGVGARIAAETGFRAFTGDLGVRVRAEAAYVGSRETDMQTFDVLIADEVLPGYTTLSASLAITLGDATLVVRGDNLEDVRRPQVWEDLLTQRPALGAGRQVRAELTWPFFN